VWYLVQLPCCVCLHVLSIVCQSFPGTPVISINGENGIAHLRKESSIQQGPIADLYYGPKRVTIGSLPDNGPPRYISFLSNLFHRYGSWNGTTYAKRWRFVIFGSLLGLFYAQPKRLRGNYFHHPEGWHHKGNLDNLIAATGESRSRMRGPYYFLTGFSMGSSSRDDARAISGIDIHCILERIRRSHIHLYQDCSWT
jgi:hypothetical protein